MQQCVEYLKCIKHSHNLQFGVPYPMVDLGWSRVQSWAENALANSSAFRLKMINIELSSDVSVELVVPVLGEYPKRISLNNIHSIIYKQYWKMFLHEINSKENHKNKMSF